MVPEVIGKIKGYSRLGRVGAEALILAAVLTAAFMIGRVSVLDGKSKPASIAVVYPPLVNNNVPKYGSPGSGNSSTDNSDTSTAAAGEPASWAFAASKTGKTYYPKGCKALDRVKSENRVYFTAQQQAETAGLTLSAACN